MPQQALKRRKYGNVKRDGFDSIREAERYQELTWIERSGEISNLRRQVRFELIPSQRDPSTGKAIRACEYIADFVYDSNGVQVVEDAKGFRTEVYKIKRKLMLQVYGIWVREV